MQDVITQIMNFPVAESIHSMQGYLVGWLLSHGVIKNKDAWGRAGFSAGTFFIAYELAEMWRISDQGDSDVMVFLATAWITGLLYAVAHYFRHQILFFGQWIKNAILRR